MKQKTLVPFFLFSLILFSTIITGQTKQKIQLGISLTSELVSDGNGLVTGLGATLDYNLLKNLGIETGAFYRAYKKSVRVTTGGQSFRVGMKDYHISIPVMIRYNNKILNIAAGPSLDIYIDYKQTTHNDTYKLQYKPTTKLNLGGQAKLSKSIWLSENIVFEPEARIGVVFPTDRAYLGLGLTLKYGF